MNIGNAVRTLGSVPLGRSFTPGPYDLHGQTIVEAATKQPIQPTPENLQLFKQAPVMFEALERIAGCLQSANGLVDQQAVKRAQEYALTATQQVTSIG